MHILVNSLIFVGIIQTVTACWSTETVDSKSTDDSTYHVSYDVDYDEELDRAQAKAQFRIGGPTGTTVRLSKPSEVNINRQAMNLVDGDESSFDVLGSYYKKEKLPFHTGYTFSYTDNAGRTSDVTAELPIAVTISSPKAKQKVSVEDDLTIYLNAPAYDREQEHIEVSMVGFQLSNGTKTRSKISASHTFFGESVSFRSKDLSQFLPGEPTYISVRRVMKDNFVDPASGRTIVITTSFTSKPHYIRLVH